jgi:hypothetical protein
MVVCCLEGKTVTPSNNKKEFAVNVYEPLRNIPRVPGQGIQRCTSEK